MLVSLLEALGTDRGYPDGRYPESDCGGGGWGERTQTKGGVGKGGEKK